MNVGLIQIEALVRKNGSPINLHLIVLFWKHWLLDNHKENWFGTSKTIKKQKKCVKPKKNHGYEFPLTKTYWLELEILAISVQIYLEISIVKMQQNVEIIYTTK